MRHNKSTAKTIRTDGGHSSKGSSKLKTVHTLYSELDDDLKARIKARIDSNGPGSSLLRLLHLKTESFELPVQLLELFFNKYQKVNHYNLTPKSSMCFCIDGERLNPTLEDVLYLTGLPIVGKPVIFDKTVDNEAFMRVFKEQGTNIISLTTLDRIAKDHTRSDDKRIKAILLILICCIIAPSTSGHECRATLVQFVEHLDQVNSYAWGAALLAYLYRELKGHGKKKLINGFTWLVVGFFFYRIKGLAEIFGVAMNQENNNTAPLLHTINLKGKGYVSNLKVTTLSEKLQQAKNLLANATECINWHPYQSIVLPDHLRRHIQFCSIITPMFCFNHVENHLPHVVAKQFKIFDDVDLSSFGSNLLKINSKSTKGGVEQNFKLLYKKYIEVWESVTADEESMNSSHCSPSPSTISSTPLISHTHSPSPSFIPFPSTPLISHTHSPSPSTIPFPSTPLISHTHSPPDHDVLVSSPNDEVQVSPPTQEVRIFKIRSPSKRETKGKSPKRFTFPEDQLKHMNKRKKRSLK